MSQDSKTFLAGHVLHDGKIVGSMAIGLILAALLLTR